MTDIVRLIGYSEVPMDEARRRLEPLLKRFGQEKIMQACEELLDVATGPAPAVARLKAEVAKLAFQILGPRRGVASESPPAAVESETPSAELAGVAVKMPRYHVMGKYEEHLAASKLQYTTHADLLKGSPFLDMLPALDYIVMRGHTRLIVAVRPNLRGNQAAQLIAYTDALLANHAAVRVWPIEGSSGWEWQEHELLAGPLKMDPNRFKLSLDDWRAVSEHCDGDKKSGRTWLADGCACACCRAARAILTARPATTRKRR